MRILLVEGDKSISKVVEPALTQLYDVDIAPDVQSIWKFVETIRYNLILLDLAMPNLDRVSVCRKLRQFGDNGKIPIILIASHDPNTNEFTCAEAEADDYIAKLPDQPIDVEELLEKIHTLIRRSSPILEWAQLRLDPSTREVKFGKKLLSLTQKEYSILKLLLSDSRHVFSRSAIIDQLWTYEDPPEEDTVKSHIKGLRQKLKLAGAAADLIETVYGVGYRLKPVTEDSKGLSKTVPLRAVDGKTKADKTHSPRVMLVDRDPQVFSTIKFLLEPLGIELCTLDDAEKIYERLEELAPDLLLLAVETGNHNGIDLCQKIRSHRQWSRLTIIFLTATTDSNTLHQIFDAGADDYLTKPIVEPVLVNRVTKNLERSQLLRGTAVFNTQIKPNPNESAQTLNQFFSLAKRQQQPLCVAILRLANFKQISQKYGSAIEESLIRQLGHILKKTFRTSDVISYWNPGEYVIAMYGTSKNDGVGKIARILGTLHKEEFFTGKGKKFKVAFNTGTAAFPEDGDEMSILLKIATEALSDDNLDLLIG